MIQRQSTIFSASMHLPKNTDIEYKYVVERQGGKDTKERVFKPAGHLTVQRDTLALNADKPAPAGTCAVPPLSVHSKLSKVLASERLSLTSRKVACFTSTKVQILTESGDVAKQTADCAVGEETRNTMLCTFRVEDVETVLGQQAQGLSIGVVGNAAGANRTSKASKPSTSTQFTCFTSTQLHELHLLHRPQRQAQASGYLLNSRSWGLGLLPSMFALLTHEYDDFALACPLAMCAMQQAQSVRAN
jgi:hypothetical protein